jgi:hypothetical protein
VGVGALQSRVDANVTGLGTGFRDGRRACPPLPYLSEGVGIHVSEVNALSNLLTSPCLILKHSLLKSYMLEDA